MMMHKPPTQDCSYNCICLKCKNFYNKNECPITDCKWCLGSGEILKCNYFEDKESEGEEG